MSCFYCYVTVACVFIPRSFLVIKVCNQGKTLCSPCILGEYFLWCWNLDDSENVPELRRKFWNGKGWIRSVRRNAWKWRMITKGQKKDIPHKTKQKKASCISHILRRNCCLKHVIESTMEGRKRKQLLDELKESRGYFNP